MSELHVTKLGEGEEILFGPTRTASTTNLSVKSVTNSEQATHTSFRTVCITNQRVIIESGDSTITFPNRDIQTIQVQRRSDKSTGSSWFNILKVGTKHGSSVNMDIPGVTLDKETLLAETFPHARITESKGLGGFLDRLLGG